MNLEPAKYIYETQIEWKSGKKGVLNSTGKPEIAIACPPEFGGHAGIWSPEDLFVGTLEVCLMTTFLWQVNRNHIVINSYQSRARGLVEFVKSKPQFTEIIVIADVGISYEKDRNKVKQIFAKLSEGCLVSNSISTKVKIKPKIVVN
jgi:organic hydroperoxide reductase OsmC/OhrA